MFRNKRMGDMKSMTMPKNELSTIKYKYCLTVIKRVFQVEHVPHQNSDTNM